MKSIPMYSTCTSSTNAAIVQARVGQSYIQGRPGLEHSVRVVGIWGSWGSWEWALGIGLAPGRVRAKDSYPALLFVDKRLSRMNHIGHHTTHRVINLRVLLTVCYINYC